MGKCLLCGSKTNRPKFCCNKHKDRFHNLHNPRGIYAHLANTRKETIETLGEKFDPIEDSIHPLDSDALGQE